MSTSVPPPVKPVSLSKQGDDRLVIVWSDGHRSEYHWTHLREHCPSARSRQQRLAPRIPPETRMSPPGTTKQTATQLGVVNVPVVASCTGRVVQSTVAASLAITLALLSRRVGLLNADIYGPSLPIMMGVEGTFDANAT